MWVLHLREREIAVKTGLAMMDETESDANDDAIAHDADIIVMGSRGRSGLAGFILGSTAHKVIHLTDRPVLIVR